MSIKDIVQQKQNIRDEFLGKMLKYSDCSSSTIENSLYQFIEKNLANYLKLKSNTKQLTLGLYINLLGEPKINIERFKSLCNIALPVIFADKMQYFLYDDQLVKNFISTCIKKNTVAVIPDIIVMPSLSFDKNGYRLGRGKGYFDKYLANYREFYSIITIGLCHDWQILEKLPFELHDQKVDYIITATQTIITK